MKPKLEALPEEQRALWPRLAEAPRQFALYGGTGLALRLGHRTSVDFDFFSTEPFVPSELKSSLAFLAGAETLQSSPNTLTVLVPGTAPVKVSFFGNLTLGHVGNPERTDDNVLSVASLLDIAACKAAVVQERAASRDYIDLWTILKTGVSLGQVLGAARAVYGEQFNPLITLKALAYFGDGDLGTLPAEVKKGLLKAASSVKEIPEIPALPGGLNGE